MSLRTLRFGDRTISYDAGLDRVQQVAEAEEAKEDASTTSAGVCVNDDENGQNDEGKAIFPQFCANESSTAV